jgi:predicted DsbA family dithiol-disulfide isomerase
MEIGEPFQSDKQQTLDIPANRAVHWYDFICPFCYVSQGRNYWLQNRGIELIELPFQAHPEVPPAGLPMGTRQGSMYQRLEQEARLADLPLRWPSRLPNSRRALSSAEWIRRHQPSKFEPFQRAIFAAHFALGEDIADPVLIEGYATAHNVDIEALRRALENGEASQAVAECESLARRSGVRGTPAWLIQGRLVEGFQPISVFERAVQLTSGIPKG